MQSISSLKVNHQIGIDKCTTYIHTWIDFFSKQCKKNKEINLQFELRLQPRTTSDSLTRSLSHFTSPFSLDSLFIRHLIIKSAAIMRDWFGSCLLEWSPAIVTFLSYYYITILLDFLIISKCVPNRSKSISNDIIRFSPFCSNENMRFSYILIISLECNKSRWSLHISPEKFQCNY